MILPLAFWITGCGQERARFARLEAQKDKLEALVAELQAGIANSPTVDANKTQSTSVTASDEFGGKIAKTYEDSVEWWECDDDGLDRRVFRDQPVHDMGFDFRSSGTSCP